MARVYRRKLKMRRKYVKRALRTRRPKMYENTFSFRRQGVQLRMTQFGLNNIGFNDFNQSWNYTSNTVAVADNMTNTIQWGSAFKFTLAQLQQHTDFTSLFDRYKIRAVSLKIMYQASDATPGGNGILPVLTYARDYDDDNAPSSLTVVSAKQSAKSVILSANKPVHILIRPRVPTAIQWGTSALSTLGLGVTKSMYINSTYDIAPHFGFKMWVNNFYAPSSSNNQITIQPTFYLSCKDPQ